jgi:predicted anti-sigma-YlaC factor YlaD
MLRHSPAMQALRFKFIAAIATTPVGSLEIVAIERIQKCYLRLPKSSLSQVGVLKTTLQFVQFVFANGLANKGN